MHRQRWTADSGHELPSGLDLRNDRDVSIVTVEWRFPLLEVDRQCRGSVGLSQFDPKLPFAVLDLDSSEGWGSSHRSALPILGARSCPMTFFTDAPSGQAISCAAQSTQC
jgi:hypothetical protein